jgi:hypothetical protein
MRALIATRKRRLALAGTALILTMLGMLLWAWLTSTPDTPAPENLMSRFLAMPALMAAAVLAFTTACAQRNSAGPAAVTAQASTPAAAQPTAPEPFRAQVVGVQWLNPLMRRDYPTEWQLLWTLGVAKPNKNDDMVKENPKQFSSVQYVSSIVSNTDGKVTMPRLLAAYVRELIAPIGNRYAMNGDYFYTIQPDNPKRWRELHGIHMELAIPATPALAVEQARDLVKEAMNSEFVFYNPKLSTANIPADVHITPGGPNAGFTSLSAAMDYLEANPTKSVWVLNWDSPQYPNDESLSENCALLILAGPQMGTQREPGLDWPPGAYQPHPV